MKKFIFSILAAAALVSCGGNGAKENKQAAAPAEKQEVVGTAVDLGLSVKWADHNMGAAKPYEYGDYYFWADIKSNDTQENYKTVLAALDSTKNICGNAKFDAATAKWGKAWRLPNTAEIEELCDKQKCSWTWTTQNNVYGYKVTGPNGNSIFLPAGGCNKLDKQTDLGTAGNYWGGETTEKGNPNMIYFLSTYFYKSYFAKNIGMSIRPVQK